MKFLEINCAKANKHIAEDVADLKIAAEDKAKTDEKALNMNEGDTEMSKILNEIIKSNKKHADMKMVNAIVHKKESDELKLKAD